MQSDDSFADIRVGPIVVAHIRPPHGGPKERLLHQIVAICLTAGKQERKAPQLGHRRPSELREICRHKKMTPRRGQRLHDRPKCQTRLTSLIVQFAGMLV
jgi:hypothetical protein